MLRFSTLITWLVWAIAFGQLAQAAPASKPSCSSTDAVLTAIKNDFGSPLNFCQWWSGASYISSSPINGVASADISRVCKCIVATPSLIGKTSTKAMASPTGISKVPNLDALRKLVAQPLPFCKFWFNAPTRKGSPFAALPAPVVSQVCKAVTATPSLVTTSAKPTQLSSSTKKIPSALPTKQSTTLSKPTTSSKPVSKLSVSSKIVSSSAKPLQASSSSAASSSTSTSVESALPTPSAVGSVFTASEVTLPPAPTATLAALIPPGLDLNNVENLTPDPQANLYFGGAQSANNATSTVAKVGVGFQHPSVVLDHTNYIKSVHCDNSSITIVFNDATAFQHSETEWQTDGHVILVTSEDTCGANGTSTMFLTASFTFDTTNLIAVGQGQQAHLADVFDTLDLDFGTVTTSNTTYVPNCGTMNGTNGTFPSAACGNSFDATLDQELGYYSGADADADSVLAAIAPSNQATLNRRWPKFISKAVSKVTSVAKAIAAPVAKAAEKVLPASVTKAVTSLASTVKSVASSALSLIPAVTLSKSLDVPLNLGPAQNDPSPWGNQYKFFEYSPDSQKDAAMIAATQKSLNGMSSSLNGVSNPKPGIQMYCVDCGIKGDFQAVGTVSASLAQGVTRCDVSLDGNLYAGVFVGVNAFAAYEKTINKDIINKGLPTLSIPGIAVLGPKVTVSMNSDLKVQAAGQMLVGASMSWPAIHASLNLLDKTKSTQSGFTPVITKKFDAWGDVTASASLALPVTLFFGVDILNGKYSKGISLVDTPAVSASAELAIAASYGTGASNGITSSTGCLGIKYNIGLSNDLSVHLLDISTYTLTSYQKPNLANGCLGRAVATVQRTTSSSAAPTSTDDASGSAATGDAGSGSSDGSDSGSGSAATTTDSGDSSAPTDAGSQPSSNAGSQPTSSDAGSSDAGSAQTTTNAGSAQTTANAGSAQSATSAATAQPTVSSTTSSVAAPTQSALKCGDYYTTSDGTYWQVACGFDYPGHDIMHTPYSNMSSCIDACSDYGSSCVGVIWVQRGQDAQNCWLKSAIPNKGSIPAGLTLFAATPVTYSPLASCPGADVYQIKCNLDYEGYDLGGLSGYSSLEACINYCDTNLDCIGTPLCYPKYDITTSPLDATKPAKKALGSCPSIDGSTFYDAAGKYYKISCGLDYEGNDIIEKDGISTLEQCINACDATAGCTGVGFAHDGYYGSNPGCYLKSAQSSNPINSTTDLSYIVDSAFLVVVSINDKVASPSPTLTSSSSASASTTPSSSTSISSSISATSSATSSKSSSVSSSLTRSSTSSSVSSSATATSDNSTNIIITDTTGQLQLTTSGDGNMYMSQNASAANFASDGSVVLGDAAGNFFVYYPDMMAAYGASRFRLAAWGSIPHGAHLLTLTPLQSGSVTALLAVDTLGNFFFPVLCTFEGAQQAKVFLVKDPTADLSFIAAQELRFTMTGGVVSQCNPLALTSKGLQALA
ncbi:uncharacterized protein M437DRAFT_75808 [Aureobasidium melanogenum CBS 110374]|uniref:Apple domain-containing protein n=1 Tax=Aureobasidium melanogenum (strain CBS 110374) TaxID=1043003 RepID=A0A074VWR6_AURM1|nr:uncharacterized protein M437DRAFT_75808 [Aureobasidium melanogenum CBS 110374]KEQ62137.1 hypothetical protein M437DRAFT_75808 [Aureobasidium melanogenum CBS 110374]